MIGRRLLRNLLAPLLGAALLVTSCGDDGGEPPTTATFVPPTSPATATIAGPTPIESATPGPTAPAPEPTVPPTEAPTPTAMPTRDPATVEPTGFPLDPATVLGVVTGPVGARTIAWGEGPLALDYSRDTQPSDDPAAANAAGWNCRVHVEYEGSPAVDWYIPEGTPITATMDGAATLYVITLSNAFDHYAVSREPYIGEPDRANAPLSPFSGPGGGKGVFVRIENEAFVTEYAHLNIDATLAGVPPDAFLDGYGAGYDYAAGFSGMRGYLDITPIAAWQVRAGDVVGYSGDSGYSEAPHLHYTVARQGGGLLCPTAEPGFEDGGWLFR